MAMNMNEFVRSKRPYLWFIMIEVPKNPLNLPEAVCSGFSVENRKIWTCHHSFKGVHYDPKRHILTARNLESGKCYRMKLGQHFERWDIAELLFQSERPEGRWNFIPFAENGKLDCHQPIWSIANPKGVQSILLEGRVTEAVPNIQSVDLFKEVLNYHTAGSLFGVNHCEQISLDPRVPLIKLEHFGGRVGASGAPLLNHNGEIIGMVLLGGNDGSGGYYSYGSHVSLLRKYQNEPPKGSKGKGKKFEEGSTSRKKGYGKQR